MFFGMLCLFLATGFLLRLPVDLGATTIMERRTKASYITDAAIQDTMGWISAEFAAGNEPCTSSAPTPTRTGSLDGWDWRCLIEPDPQTPPNAPVDERRIYTLTATAQKGGIDIYRVVANIQAYQTFAQFSMFIDQSGTARYDYIVTPATRIEGPIHKNRPINFLINAGLFGLNSPPIDSSISTTAADHNWFRNTVTYPGTQRPSVSPVDQFSDLFANGYGDLTFGAEPRPMPTDSQLLANAAWGGTAPAPGVPAANQVTVNPAGGVHIEGPVDRMELRVNTGGNFELEIDQAGAITTIIEDPAANARIVTDTGGSTTAVPGIGTGVIFCTDDILSLQGSNKGAHTIATMFEAGKNVEITGALLRNDTAQGTQSTGTDDRLGLVSNIIYIADHSILPRGSGTPLFLHAAMMATDRFHVRGWDPGADPGYSTTPGRMAIYGGLTTGETWRVASFSNQFNLAVRSGYGGLLGVGTPDIFYDALLAEIPPPEYPTSEPARLRILSWKEQSL